MRNTVIGLAAAAAAIIVVGSTLSASACGRHSGQHFSAYGGPHYGYGKYGRPRGGHAGRHGGAFGSQRYGRSGEG